MASGKPVAGSVGAQVEDMLPNLSISDSERQLAVRAVQRLTREQASLEYSDDLVLRYVALKIGEEKTRITAKMLLQVKQRDIATTKLKQSLYIAQKKLKPPLAQELDASFFVDPNSLTDFPPALSRASVWVVGQVVERSRLGVGVLTWESVVGRTFSTGGRPGLGEASDGIAEHAAPPQPDVVSQSSSARDT